MGMNRNITLVRGIKVEYSAINGKDLDDFEFPNGVGWYGNGEYDTDYVIIGDWAHGVDLSEIQGSVEINNDSFSVENDEKIFNFCLNVLGLFCDRSDIKNWAVADFS